MVATETKSELDRLRSLWFLYPMFYFKSIRELTCLFVAVCILTSQSLADDQDFAEEFLKREYSLAKPYRGKLSLPSTGGYVNGTLANKCN